MGIVLVMFAVSLAVVTGVGLVYKKRSRPDSAIQEKEENKMKEPLRFKKIVIY